MPASKRTKNSKIKETAGYLIPAIFAVIPVIIPTKPAAIPVPRTRAFVDRM